MEVRTLFNNQLHCWIVASLLSPYLFRSPCRWKFWSRFFLRSSVRQDLLSFGWLKESVFIFGRQNNPFATLFISYPTYSLSIFQIPTKMAYRIEKLQRDFLQSRFRESKRHHLVECDLMCKPKRNRGLGLGRCEEIRIFFLLMKCYNPRQYIIHLVVYRCTILGQKIRADSTLSRILNPYNSGTDSILI